MTAPVLDRPIATDESASPKHPQRPAVSYRLRVQRTLLTVTVVLIVIVQVYPLLWLFITSFRTASDFAGGHPFAFPSEFTLDNYVRAFSTGNLWLNIVNSLIVTLGASALIVVAGMMAAYALQVLGSDSATWCERSSCSASSCPCRSPSCRCSSTTRRSVCSTPICR